MVSVPRYISPCRLLLHEVTSQNAGAPRVGRVLERLRLNKLGRKNDNLSRAYNQTAEMVLGTVDAENSGGE